MAKKAKAINPGDLGEETAISISPLKMLIGYYCLLGTTPLITNRKSRLVMQSLLVPPRAKNKAEKQSTLKHNPVEEYRQSMYRSRLGNLDDKPTFLHLPTGAFKSALRNAALRTPGATKTEIGQITSIPDVEVSLYGIPRLYMTDVRQGGIVKTPDIRTRAIFIEWCCMIPVRYVSTLIKDVDLSNLIASAGMLMGIGDDRQEKGHGSYGGFELCSKDDPRFVEIIKHQGKAAQIEAFNQKMPECYDEMSEELLAYFMSETKKREMPVPEMVLPPEQVNAIMKKKQARSRANKHNGEMHV